MTLKILVVDDNRDTLRAYIKSLQRKVKSKGFDFGENQLISAKSLIEVEGCDSVLIALEKLRSQTFEVLIVDLKIPGSSGQEMGGLPGFLTKLEEIGVKNCQNVYCKRIPAALLYDPK